MTDGACRRQMADLDASALVITTAAELVATSLIS